VIREETFPSREHPSLEAVVARMLAGGPARPIEAACFGVPGPVVDGRCVTTNLPWQVEERSLARAIRATRVKLVNDLEAAGYGVLGLDRAAIAPLQAGAMRPGNRVLVAAGTGLGEALLVWDGNHHVVVASEGGHADFAPRTERQMDLLRFLKRETDHVSVERVLSGPGLHSIYRFLRSVAREPEPAWLTRELAAEDPSAAVSEAALAGTDPVCAEALDIFVSVYGAEAGNLALKALALGGVYVGGGIAPKIVAKLLDGAFLRAFCDKGRLAPLLARIPVKVVLDPTTALRGAAAHLAATADEP